MRVYLGSDHAGFELKTRLVAWLRDAGHEPVDCGPVEYDAEDDYPPFVIDATERALGDPGSVAIVLGGSGNGEAMAANKVRGARAALCWSVETARLAREHNDANVCSLGARVVDADEQLRIVETFLTTAFTGDERHVRRIAQVSAYESR
ncbi:MAG: ribose-5-phosphate isomerase [Mycobacteriales bacterium]|nr:ribose-5-phosphate isomerase [Frankia sp.]